MKLFALLPALLLAGASGAQAQVAPGYEITGYIKGLADGTRLYLINGFKRIDSATVRQERFTLRGRLAEPAFVYLYAGRGRGSYKLTDIVLENQPVSLTGSQPDYDHVTVENSTATRQFHEWFTADTRLAQRRAELSKAAKVLPSPPDSTTGRLLRQAQAVQQARVALLKASVRRYHDSAAGAALPTLCTLGKSLTSADYQEMYQTLTPAWQQTALGREILAEARQHQANSN